MSQQDGVIEYCEKKRCNPCSYLVSSAKKFYDSISYPKHFMIFNVICLVQTVPALYYYITFYSNDFYIIRSTGMAPVWGCTIGAIATAIVGSALVPIPPNTITKTFCIAVIIWEFLVSISEFIAAVCLAYLQDFHGFVWSMIGCFTTGYAGYFLLWVGRETLNKANKTYESEEGHEKSRLRYSLDIPCDLEEDMADSKSDIFIQIGDDDDKEDIHAKKSESLEKGDEIRSIEIPITVGTSPEKKKKAINGLLLQSEEKEKGIKSMEIPLSLDSLNSEKDLIPHTSSNDTSEVVKFEKIYSADDTIPISTKDTIPISTQNRSLEKGTVNDENKKLSLCSYVQFIITQILLWCILFVFAVIPIGFGVQQAYQAANVTIYPKPGKSYIIPTPININSKITTEMHISCLGSDKVKYNRPTIILEADKFTSGFSLLNMQSNLASKNWRVCYYDRMGYGWSFISPLGSNKPEVTASRLNQLLVRSNELNPLGLIMVGHGDGSEIAQIYIYLYPDQVKGFVMIDGYSNIDRLQGYTTTRIAQATLAKCGNLEISRALETCVLMQPVSKYFNSQIKSKNQFIPSSERNKYYSTQTNGFYYAAQKNDICFNPPTMNTDYLDDVGVKYTINGRSLGWPQIGPKAPVLIVSAGNTLTNGDPNSKIYAEQAQLYNQTLSSSSQTKWVICDSCDHSLAYDSNSDFVSNEINVFFESYYAV
jgi:pimeloyl-ACP methyl ester carboxylesterase